jgi:hypothetical protein
LRRICIAIFKPAYINGSANGSMEKQIDPKVSEYLAHIGSKGGRVGGKATGAPKRRSREHYAKIAEIQRERWKRYRKAKEAALKNGSATKR